MREPAKFEPLKCPKCGDKWADCPHLIYEETPAPRLMRWVMGFGVAMLVFAAIVGLIVVPMMVLFG